MYSHFSCKECILTPFSLCCVLDVIGPYWFLMYFTVDLILYPVPPEVQPTFNQSQLAFRDRETTLDFSITGASPDVEPADIEWHFESNHLNLSVVLNATDNDHYYFSENRRSLTIFNLTINDTGRYLLIARNPAGVQSGFIDLNIQGDINQTIVVRRNMT